MPLQYEKLVEPAQMQFCNLTAINVMAHERMQSGEHMSLGMFVNARVRKSESDESAWFMDIDVSLKPDKDRMYAIEASAIACFTFPMVSDDSAVYAYMSQTGLPRALSSVHTMIEGVTGFFLNGTFDFPDFTYVHGSWFDMDEPQKPAE